MIHSQVDVCVCAWEGAGGLRVACMLSTAAPLRHRSVCNDVDGGAGDGWHGCGADFVHGSPPVRSSR